MADEAEDDDDYGAPPDVPGLRVWTDPGGDRVAVGPPTEDERKRFNIPDTPAPGARPPVPAVAEMSASATVLTALIAKFPDFSPSWPPEVQTVWFASFAKLMEAGLK